MNDVINMQAVNELVSLSDDGDPELLIDLIQMYLEDGPLKLHEITEGLTHHDWDRMERAAHSLKGSAGHLGAHLVQEDCDKLQLASRNQEATAAEAAVADLRGHFTDAEQALQDILRSYS